MQDWLYAGLALCRAGFIQDWFYAGLALCRTGFMQGWLLPSLHPLLGAIPLLVLPRSCSLQQPLCCPVTVLFLSSSP